jgi:site-specific DNA recombinase
MTSTNEPAGIWVRVSTGGQDEAQQVPEVERHCDSHSYIIAKRYELNDKSASKGEQQAALDEMLEDMRDGTIRVLVCWRSNRLERRGPESVFRLKRLVKDAGGRIEVTQEPLFNTVDLSGEAMVAINAVVDGQLPLKISEDTSRKIRQIKADGKVYNGNAPWGYDIVGPKYGKTLKPTDVCREYVPQIFERCIKGDSLRTIAAWLDSEHVPTARGGKWNEGSVRWIINCRAYAGRWTVNGQTIVECEAIILPSIFDRANDALRNRGKRGPVSDNRPMLANLRCARCADKGIDSPMFQIKAGKKKELKYRCYGRGPQRKGCGNLVLVGLTDFVVASQIFVHSTEPHTIKEWVDGQNWDDEISNLMADLDQLKFQHDVLSDEYDEAEREIKARIRECRRLNETAQPGHYEKVKTGQTVGEYFWNLTPDGKREYLATRDIRVEKVPTEVNLSGIRVVIDGEERPVTVREFNAAMRHLASVS